MLLMLAFGYFVCVLHELEGEPPLFHARTIYPGEKGDYPTRGLHCPYYLCYLYPRPEYWVGRGREVVAYYLGRKP